MGDRLPAAVIQRPKKGFGIPVAAWLKGPLSDLLNDLLSDTRIKDAGYLDPVRVRRLIDEHQAGRRNHRKVLWTMLNLELWRDARGIPGRG
jgi:asparagine synthase (glutamine-hydrolysing)